MMTANASTTDHVFALLETIADPKKAKARLQEIADREAGLEARWAEVNSREAALAKSEAAHAAALASLDNQTKTHERNLANLARAQEDLRDQKRAFAMEKADHAAKLAEHAERLKALAENVSTLEREKATLQEVAERFAEVSRATRADLDARVMAVAADEDALKAKRAKLAAAMA